MWDKIKNHPIFLVLKRQLISFYNKMTPQTKLLILLLGLAFFFNFLFNKVYKVQQDQLDELVSEYKDQEENIISSQAEMKNIDEAKKELQDAQESLAKTKEKREELEGWMPFRGNLSHLLGEMVKQTQGLDIAIEAIKPIPQTKEEVYARLNIEINLVSKFSDIITYLQRLEKISEYLTIRDIEIERFLDEGGTDFNLACKLSVTTFITDSTEGAQAAEKNFQVRKIEPLQITRDLFRSGEEPVIVTVKDEIEYTLMGISRNADKPTAIINDDVYFIGDKIGDIGVQSIHDDHVVLIEKGKEFSIKLPEWDKP